MKRRGWICVVAVVGLIAFLVAAFFPTERRRIAQMESFVRDHEPQLQRYVSDVLADRVAKQPGFVTFEPPKVSDRRATIGGVTRDRNGNVYFVTSSTPMSNVGFVRRQGKDEFLGDQMEPRIAHIQHLFGDWWYYRSK